jgi:uncharacterized protein YbcV (DUF1398 family)
MGIVEERIAKAYQWALANRPKVDGYPYLAEALRQAGVTRYVYSLPSNQCMYFCKDGHVVGLSEVTKAGLSEVPRFDKDAFVKVLRATQAGDSTFPEFLKRSWETGIVRYEADLIARRVTYYGAEGESYVEDYPAVEVGPRQDAGVR